MGEKMEKTEEVIKGLSTRDAEGKEARRVEQSIFCCLKNVQLATVAFSTVFSSFLIDRLKSIF
jgi:hypothetical protein